MRFYDVSITRVVPCLVLSVLLLSGASGCGEDERQRAPASVQRQLPIDLYLANMCPGAESPPSLIRKLRRQAGVLLREAREHPEWLVEWTFYDAHGEDDKGLITIRQLAREHLESIKSHPRPCEPKLSEKLEAVAR